MDGVLCDYEGRRAEYRASRPEILHPQYEEGFFSGLDPIPGAVDSFRAISERFGSEVYLLTSPAENSPGCYSEKRQWVEAHLGRGSVSRLIISPHKHLLRGDYLVDDHVEGKGQDRFGGRLIHFGSEEFPDWAAVLEFFRSYRPYISHPDVMY